MGWKRQKCLIFWKSNILVIAGQPAHGRVAQQARLALCMPSQPPLAVPPYKSPTYLPSCLLTVVVERACHSAPWCSSSCWWTPRSQSGHRRLCQHLQVAAEFAPQWGWSHRWRGKCAAQTNWSVRCCLNRSTRKQIASDSPADSCSFGDTLQ